MKKVKPLSIILLILVSILYAGGSSPQATNYEYFFQTRNTGGVRVYFEVSNSDNPHWDEGKNIVSGTDMVTFFIDGDDNECHSSSEPLSLIHQLNQGLPVRQPSIGYLRYTINVTNSEKNAWFVLETQGQLFQGDKYFTYDWAADKFYMGGSCGSYGTNEIDTGTVIITSVDDGNGNLAFQPSDPTNLVGNEYNNHPRLTWSASEPYFSDITYMVHRKYTDTGSWTDIAQDLTNTSYTDTDVDLPLEEMCEVYYYKVTAHTDKDSGPSNIVSYTGAGYTTNPTNLTVTPTGRYGYPHLSWSHNGQPAGVMYRVWRKDGSGSNWWVAYRDLTQTSLTDYDIWTIRYPGETITFYYRVQAYLPCYDSGYSNTVSIVGGYRNGIPKAIAEDSNLLPESFALHSAHPNPFNPVTTLRYDLPQDSRVQLIIYDVMGREVYAHTAVEESGYRSVTWQGRNQAGRALPSGIYLYRLLAVPIDGSEPFIASRKMLLLK